VTRATVEIAMPVRGELLLSIPSAAVLRWSGCRMAPDLGKIAYLRRETSNNFRGNHVFDPTSLTHERDNFIRRSIRILSDLAEKPSTLAKRLADVLHFLAWTDARGIEIFLDNPRSVEVEAKAYFLFRNQLITSGKANRNSVANSQYCIITYFRQYFDDENWGKELPATSGSKNDVNRTEAPTEAAQSLLMASCRATFLAICDLVLNHKPFPYRFEAPFGQNGEVVSLLLLPNGESSLNCNRLWDAATGQPVSVDKLNEFFAGHFKFGRTSVCGAKRRAKLLIEEGKKPRSDVRLEFALTGISSFAYMLLGHCTLNLEQFCQLEVSAEDEANLSAGVVTRQGFREIKGRAAGRDVYFEIPLSFIPLLKRYLELRRYVVQDLPIAQLLIGRSREGVLQPIPRTFVVNAHGRLVTLGAKVKRLQAAELRAFIHDRLIRTETPDITSKVMNHSLDTTMRAYANGSTESAREEMGSFLDVLETRARSKKNIETGVGDCTDHQNPKAILLNSTIVPDCTSIEGCLFCDKYKVHADENDTRKLLSCKRCLILSSQASSDPMGFDRVFEVYMTRINWLLDELKTRLGDTAFLDIEQDVNEYGNLSSFWEAKLVQLQELGLV
jgi:hypothetical protein